jgi:hypothetical protein
MWKRFERLTTKRDEGRAHYGGIALRLGIGVLTLLTLVSFAGWLLRRGARETAPRRFGNGRRRRLSLIPFQKPRGRSRVHGRLRGHPEAMARAIRADGH